MILSCQLCIWQTVDKQQNDYFETCRLIIQLLWLHCDISSAKKEIILNKQTLEHMENEDVVSKVFLLLFL